MVIRNFLFHRVSDKPDAMWPPMKPSLFTRIIGHLTQHFTVVPLEHYLADPGAFQTKKKIVTVSFDDGYKDNMEIAAPILKKFNCPASFYVITDCIDRNIPAWTYIIDHTLQKTKRNSIGFTYDFVPEKLRSVQLQLNGQPGSLAGEIKPWLKKITDKQRLLVIQSLLEQCNDVPVPGDLMMSWYDLRQLDKEGFIIGSHSHSHPLLASLQEETEISAELKMSFRKIQQEIGKPPQTISYPVGSFDERVIRLSKKEGYKSGLAVEQRFFRVDKDDIFKIPRVELYQEPWWKVQMRVSGMYSRLKKIWA